MIHDPECKPALHKPFITPWVEDKIHEILVHMRFLMHTKSPFSTHDTSIMDTKTQFHMHDKTYKDPKNG